MCYAVQDREVDAALVALQNKVQGVKGALSTFVGKMEHEQLTWCELAAKNLYITPFYCIFRDF